MRRRHRLDSPRSTQPGRTRAPAAPPAGGSGGRSSGPAHGQGLGVGLYLLALGSSPPGQQTHGATAIAPTMRDSTKTAAAAGQAGVNPQSYVITLPTYRPGDLVILHVLWNSGISGSPTTPTGWTLQSSSQQSGSGTSIRTYVYTRIMAASDGATVTVQEPTAFGATFSAAASSWTHGSPSAPIASSNGTSSGSSGSATWTGGSVTVPAGAASAVATVVTAQVGTDDVIATAPAVLVYNYNDTSHIVNGGVNFHFAIGSYLPVTSGAASAGGTFTAGHLAGYGAIGLVLAGG